MIESAESSRELIRVQAGSYREALERIHAEYGAGFRIVHTRVVKRDGLRGMVGGRGVEVFLAAKGTAGSSPSEAPPVVPSAEQVVRPMNGPPAATPAEVTKDLRQQLRRLLLAREAAGEGNAAEAPAGPVIPPLESVSVERRTPLHAKVLLEALERSVREGAVREHAAPAETVPAGAPSTFEAPAPAPAAPTAPARAEETPVARTRTPESRPPVGPTHPILRRACKLLLDRGFSQESSSELTLQLRQRTFETIDVEDEARIEASAARHLGEVLRPKLPPCAPVTLPETAQGKPRVVAFVGPTGVGKTTTIAKLAAPLRVVHNRRVALVTLDTFRLGAVEQITRYAEIVGIEVHAVERPEHLSRVVDSLSDQDVIFVDTAGTSPKNEDQLHHIQESLAGLEEAQVHLCVPASRSRAALLEAAESYRPLGYDRLLITKGDESVGAGQLLDLFQVARVPVSYITNGQNVPEDVATATSERLESLMMGVSP